MPRRPQPPSRRPGAAAAPQPPPVSAGAAAPPAPPPTPAPAASPGPTGSAPRLEDSDLAQRIADEKQLRQSTDQQIQLLALQFQATRCNEDDVLAGNDDPNLPLVTCSHDHTTVYLLDKSIISGEQIKNATSGLDQQRGDYVVDLEFKSDASKVWADFTAANVGTQTAFTLDSQVVSAPEIQEAIPGGRTQITGQFTADSARELANVLKYGSLPLSFESSEAETVSATLGLTSLRAGLIAGCASGCAGAALLAAVLPGARNPDALSLIALRRNGIRDTGAAGQIHRLHARPGRHRRSDHRYRHHRRLVRGVLRTHQRRDPRGAFVPIGRAAWLGTGPQDDPVR